MKRVFIILIAIGLLSSAALVAQETSKEMKMSGPPKPIPLGNKMMNKLVGEWQGWFEGMGGMKSSEWMRLSLALDKQFLIMEAASIAPGMNYRGMGAITLDLETGAAHGYWIDNYRGRYEGKGKQEGNKLIMEWDGTMGKSVRIMELAGDNKLITIVEMPEEDGKIYTYKGEMTRKNNGK